MSPFKGVSESRAVTNSMISVRERFDTSRFPLSTNPRKLKPTNEMVSIADNIGFKKCRLQPPIVV